MTLVHCYFRFVVLLVHFVFLFVSLTRSPSTVSQPVGKSLWGHLHNHFANPDQTVHLKNRGPENNNTQYFITLILSINIFDIINVRILKQLLVVVELYDYTLTLRHHYFIAGKCNVYLLHLLPSLLAQIGTLLMIIMVSGYL